MTSYEGVVVRWTQTGQLTPESKRRLARRNEQAFTKAIVLALTAPDGRERDIDHLCYALSEGLTPRQVERCKFVALERVARAEWLRYVRTHDLPPDIPARPDRAYKHHGWAGWQDWLGWTGDEASRG